MQVVVKGVIETAMADVKSKCSKRHRQELHD